MTNRHEERAPRWVVLGERYVEWVDRNSWWMVGLALVGSARILWDWLR